MQATKHCVMVSTPFGQRVQLFTEEDLQELVRSGRVKKLKGSLWEMNDKVPEQRSETPSPVARTRHSNHGSKRK